MTEKESSEIRHSLERIAKDIVGKPLLHRAIANWLARDQPPADLLTLPTAPRDYAWIAVAALAETAGWPIDMAALDDGIDWLSNVALDRVGVPAPLTRDTIAQLAIALAVRRRPRLQSWLGRVARHAKGLHEPAWAANGALIVLGDVSDERLDPAFTVALASVGIAIEPARLSRAAIKLSTTNQKPEDPLHAAVMLQALAWAEQTEQTRDSTDNRTTNHSNASKDEVRVINATAASAAWIELIIECSGDEICVGARGSRDEQIRPQPIGITRDAILRFASSIQRAAQHGKSLGPDLLAECQAIEQTVLGREVNALFHRLRDTSQEPLLVRLTIHDRALQVVPWEALYGSCGTLGFWGTSPNVLPVRNVVSGEPWQPRKITGAVRVLPIAPTGSTGLANLKLELDAKLNAGEVEWLEPISDDTAKSRHLARHLSRRPKPHVIHFLGHGGIDKHGRPTLRMADDDDGDEDWLPVDVFAQHLQANFSQTMRLVVLEACEGAAPTTFASAAEILANAGVDAVAAHLWPVRADRGLACSMEMYRALTQSDSRGDIAAAINEARRCILTNYDKSAEAHSPVLYLRGTQSRIFDFTNIDPAMKGSLNPLPNPTMGKPLKTNNPIPGNETIAIRVNSTLPLDLIDVLADLYPDVREARALWVRAGGKTSDIENIPRPRDLWQHIWTQSVNGARVRPISILKLAQADFPINQLLAHHISLMES